MNSSNSLLNMSLNRDNLISGDPYNNNMSKNQYIVSTNGRYVLIMQNDGNLVIYRRSSSTAPSNTWVALWGTATNGTNNYNTGYMVMMQSSGNMDVFGINSNTIWTSNTTQNSGYSPYKVIIQNDGNLVIYNVNLLPIWASNTMQPQ